YLALHGRAAEIYDLHVFHAFQETIVGSPLDGYHYSYPPVMLLLTAPFALIPYVPALFVWLSASWYAFYRALKLAMPGRGVLLLALVAAALAHLTGIAFGPLFILPLFIVALQMSFGARGAAVSASSPRLPSAQGAAGWRTCAGPWRSARLQAARPCRNAGTCRDQPGARPCASGRCRSVRLFAGRSCSGVQ